MIRGQCYYKCQVGDCSKVWQFWKMSIYVNLFLIAEMYIIWISRMAEYCLVIECKLSDFRFYKTKWEMKFICVSQALKDLAWIAYCFHYKWSCKLWICILWPCVGLFQSCLYIFFYHVSHKIALLLLFAKVSNVFHIYSFNFDISTNLLVSLYDISVSFQIDKVPAQRDKVPLFIGIILGAVLCIIVFISSIIYFIL